MEASTTTMETSTALMLGDLNCPCHDLPSHIINIEIKIFNPGRQLGQTILTNVFSWATTCKHIIILTTCEHKILLSS